MAYLDAAGWRSITTGLHGEGDGSQTMERVTWEGGQEGDTNADGIPYGTFKYLVPQMLAKVRADRQKVAEMTAPWANIFGSEDSNPLGISTPVLAVGAVVAVFGLVFLKKKLKKRKAKR